MRVQHIRIGRWRHFDNIRLDIPSDAPVVCLVGGNGTGKTQIFELIASCAHHIGLSQGFESGRGNPHSESGDFEVQFYIAPGAVRTLDDSPHEVPADLQSACDDWDRTLTVVNSIGGSSAKVVAGGVSDEQVAERLAGFLVGLIRNSELVHYLMLDADRAYPRVMIQSHELGSAFETDWAGNAKSRSFALTKSLYEEWFRYLIGTENRESNAHVQAIRRARENGLPDPTFVDKMSGYKDAVQKVLPHLLFTGVNSQSRQIHFDTTGIPLSFDQLSGGEREIAFLIGQIERFGLRSGLLLVDEPELHLNYDLLRAWIGFLKNTVEEGQIWLATHALEVVEVTGQDATFLLERDQATRLVAKCAPIASRPVVATLSRAVGSPAFSISNLAFVLVEGEEEIGERERFRLLTGARADVRFIEAGNCREVLRRTDGLKAIAGASGEKLKLGGIIDGDWRGPSEREALEKQGFHVLGVHEVENLLLHPETIRYLMNTISRDPSEYDAILTAAADKRAGSYIFDAARTQKAFEDYPEPHAAVRTLVHQLTWEDFDEVESRCQSIVDADPGLTPDQAIALKRQLIARSKIYARVRSDGSLWKVCEGKEVFRSIASKIGFSDTETAERAVIGIWTKSPELRPAELIDLKNYIEKVLAG